jgi:hypothetical protein
VIVCSRSTFFVGRAVAGGQLMTGHVSSKQPSGVLRFALLLTVCLGCGEGSTKSDSNDGRGGGPGSGSGGQGTGGIRQTDAATGGTAAPGGSPGGSVAGSSGGAAGSSGGGGGTAPTGLGGAAGQGGAAGAAGHAGATGGAGAAGHVGATGSAGTAGHAGGSGGAGAAGRGGAGAGGAAGGGAITLDPTPGDYQQTCDGSLGVMIDGTHFLDGNDETQGMRLYTRGASGKPLKTIDVSGAIGLSTDDEADLEDATRIGDRVYVISSHGRNKDGKLERSRYRFFAMDIGGASPNITLTVAGYTSTLLDQMLEAANWVTPDAAVIATLTAASKLGTTTDASLAPKVDGTNIEGLTWAPTAAQPNQLLIGFRNPTQGNPTQGGKAIVVSLLNADAVLAGATAQFGEATLLDLGGLGIRGMTWSPVHQELLLLAGPQDESAGPFQLLTWSGVPGDAPALVEEITTAPTDSAPEAIVTYSNTRDVQILFDQGDHLIGGDACKDADTSDQFFSDVIVQVP